VLDAALLFGRYTQSGWGPEMGHEVLQDYTKVKAVTTQLQGAGHRNRFGPGSR
jgi:phenylacetaldehyde dehydrogenase